MTKAKDIMTTNVLAVRKDTDIYEAIQIIVANNVTGLPVVDADDFLVGIVTEKDVLSRLYNIEDQADCVGDYMTEDVVSFDIEDDMIAVCECLVNNHFRRVPILRERKLVGIISRRDLIKYILEPISASN